ncbi:MAG TPA: IS1595 family transposase [Gaiellaceae bacterium]|nr:IS1595 family transposase [Gaiellaceae bacterium]
MAKTTFLQEMNLPDLIEQFGTGEKCRDYLEDLRWPDGPQCPRCESKKASRIKARNQWECGECRYQYSVTSGTLFHDSHLPLWKWFLAIYLITESKKGISAKQMQRLLGTKSYKTAWYLCHRIRAAMETNDHEQLLVGIVEADETWIGGKHKGQGQGQKQRQMVMGAVQRDGSVRLRVGDLPNKATLHGFLNDVVADDAEAIFTDSWKAYDGIGDEDTRHESVNHFREEWVRGQVHTQTIENVWSLFKRSIIGSYHQLSVKHLPAYLDELEWRYNNRDNPYLFRDTVLALVKGDALPMKELTADRH